MTRPLLAAAAFCALSACGPAGGQTPSAAQRAAEMAEAAATADAAAIDADVAAKEAAGFPPGSIAYRLTQVEREAMSPEARADLAAYEASRLAREYGGEAAAEPVEIAYPVDPMSGWFALNPDEVFCEPMMSITGSATPRQLADSAPDRGARLVMTQVSPGAIHVAERGPRGSIEMILVQGEDQCFTLLERMNNMRSRGAYVPMQ